MSDVPSTLINGDLYDWNQIEIHCGGIHYIQIKEGKYSDEVSRALQYGTSARPIGRTLGQIKPDHSITLFKAAWEDMKYRVLGGDGFMRKSFNVVYMYGATGQPTYTDTVFENVVTKVEGGGSAGSDASEVSLTLMPLRILWNGYDPLGKALQSLI